MAVYLVGIRREILVLFIVFCRNIENKQCTRILAFVEKNIKKFCCIWKMQKLENLEIGNYVWIPLKWFFIDERPQSTYFFTKAVACFWSGSSMFEQLTMDKWNLHSIPTWTVSNMDKAIAKPEPGVILCQMQIYGVSMNERLTAIKLSRFATKRQWITSRVISSLLYSFPVIFLCLLVILVCLTPVPVFFCPQNDFWTHHKTPWTNKKREKASNGQKAIKIRIPIST